MNTIRKYQPGILALSLCLILLAASCEKWMDPGYNTDPARASDVPMELLLPAIQLEMGYNLMGNPVTRVTCIWMQMYDHVGRSSFGPNRGFTPADVNTIWSSVYTRQLMNSKLYIEQAREMNSPYNMAAGQILTAYILGAASDLWGDIPYSDALRGGDNVISVGYDKQERVYDSIHALLDRAIENLGRDPSENTIDIRGDAFFEGNPAAWLRAARAIKARHALQLSKRKGEEAYEMALRYSDAFTLNEHNLECPFTSANPNPLYQFMEQRAGDLVMCSTLLNEMDSLDDPRIPLYYSEDESGGISGSQPGYEQDGASLPGPFLAAKDAPTCLMSHAELKFIEAEAAFMTGDKERAARAYKTGVAASLLHVTGEEQEAWLDSYINTETAATITLEKIILQKRHALVGQLQPYSDWRRTGIPELLPGPYAFLEEIPQRFPYAQDEILLNAENVPGVESLLVPVWWAQ
jgi:hypothetical protein